MRRRTLAALVVAALLPATGAVAAGESSAQRLAQVVESFAADLGVRADADTAVAAVSAPVAGALADVITQLRSCHELAQASMHEQLAARSVRGSFASAPAAAWSDDHRACGERVVTALTALRPVLAADSPSGPVDVWPVLRYEPAVADHTYLHDYVLLVDEGGNDTYLNNSGGNGMDLLRGPASSGAPLKEPARGCEVAFDLIAPDRCVITSAALQDLDGHDRYSRFEAPTPLIDGVCTASLIGRRIFVQGTGVSGVGVFMDDAGDDTYVGKVLTTGAGHLGGFGYFEDGAGNDSYTAIRIAIGAATVSGEAVFIDRAGHDTYDYYTPAPLVPGAPNLTDGSGGVRDDLNRCDIETFQTVGSGVFGGVASFEDAGGDDAYVAPARSIGHGSLGGTGRFVDGGAGADTYAGPGATGGRGNGVTLSPSATDQGSFSDDG